MRHRRSPRTRIAATVLAAAAAATPGLALGESVSIVLNGKAKHFGGPAGASLNEENWGAGLEYEFAPVNKAWVPFFSVSGFSDSNDNFSYYAGGGLMRRYRVRSMSRIDHFDAGFVGFLMTRYDYRGGEPFPGVLPAVSFGTRRLALNVTYIPKIAPDIVPALFFQVKILLRKD